MGSDNFMKMTYFFLIYIFFIMVNIMWEIPNRKKKSNNVVIYLYGNVFIFWVDWWVFEFITSLCVLRLFMFCCFNYFQILMITLGPMKLFLIDSYNTLMLYSVILFNILLLRGHLRPSDFFFLFITGKWESNHIA